MFVVTWLLGGASQLPSITMKISAKIFLTFVFYSLATGNEEPVEFEPPCPMDWNPDPCECTGHSLSRNIECTRALGGYQLREVFTSLRDGLPFSSFKIIESNLTSLSSSSFGRSNFTKFIITRTPLTVIPSDFFITSKDTVKEISITHTHLEEFDFKMFNNFTYLEVLDLSNNRVTFISTKIFGPEGLPRLLELNLRGNQIVTIPGFTFSPLPYLERLDLSSNNLTKLSSKSLSNPGMKEIVVVFLTDNSISEIDQHAFDDLIFSSIHLENNKLERFPRKIYETLVDHLYDRDATFYLADNKFECDESIKWLVETSAMKKHYLRDFTCKNGKLLERLTIEDLKKVN